MTPLEEAHAQIAALILLLSENGVDVDVTLATLREAKAAAAFDADTLMTAAASAPTGSGPSSPVRARRDTAA
jgi:hypothetical protein